MVDKKFVSGSSASREEAGALSVPLDLESCVSMLGGDRAMVFSLLHEFSTNLEDQIKAISDALADENPEEVRLVAHSIKGGAAVFCAYSIMAMAASLEEIGKSGDLAQGENKILSLTKEATVLRSYCKELMT